LPHHDQQASDDWNQTEHGRILPSNMLLLNLILLIDVTFSTPTPDNNIQANEGASATIFGQCRPINRKQHRGG
jgi:hypothetical protein